MMSENIFIKEFYLKEGLYKGLYICIYERREYKELREDVLDEEKAIEETLERLYGVRTKFNPQE